MSIFNMKAQIPQQDERRGEQGFSLIEIAIALAVIGLILVPFIVQYNIDAQQTKINLTRAQMGVTKAALQKYAVKYGRYPRPADPNIPSGAVGAGIETVTPAVPCFPYTALPCIGTGMRDTDADGDTDADPIYVGSVPFATLGIPEDQTIDGYDNRLTYTVSAYLTDTTTFDEYRGVLRLQGNDGVVVDSASDNRSHFVLVSHGEDAKGAFTLAGVRTFPCGDISNARDNENCNYDGLFDDGRSPTATGRSSGRSLAAGATFWDDSLAYTANISSDFWLPVALDQDMSNRNAGSVLVNTDTLTNPDVRLEVNGATRAEGVYTPELCDNNGANCASPILIGRDTQPAAGASDGIVCDANSAMTGISMGSAECNTLNIANPGGLVFTSCPSGELPRGVNADGTIYCEAP